MTTKHWQDLEFWGGLQNIFTPHCIFFYSLLYLGAKPGPNALKRSGSNTKRPLARCFANYWLQHQSGSWPEVRCVAGWDNPPAFTSKLEQADATRLCPGWNTPPEAVPMQCHTWDWCCTVPHQATVGYRRSLEVTFGSLLVSQMQFPVTLIGVAESC